MFNQQREDPMLECDLIARYTPLRCLLVGSGGETLFTCVNSANYRSYVSFDVADTNPVQIQLIREKIKHMRFSPKNYVAALFEPLSSIYYFNGTFEKTLKDAFDDNNFDQVFSSEAIAKNFSPEIAEHVDPKLSQHLQNAFNTHKDSYHYTPFTCGAFTDLPPYLNPVHYDQIHSAIYTLHTKSIQDMLEIKKYDFVSISNISDWQSKEENIKLVALLSESLHPNGVVLVRTMTNHNQIDALFHDWVALEVLEDVTGLYRSFAYQVKC